VPEQKTAEKQPEVDGPVTEAPGLEALSFDAGGTRSHEHAILRLQGQAGNRAVSGRLARVQRAPSDGNGGSAVMAPRSFMDDYKALPDPLTASIMGGPAPAAKPKPVLPPKAAHGRRRDGLTALTGGTDLGEAPIGSGETGQMTYTATLDEIAALEGWLSKRQQSSPETVPAENRLQDLYKRIADLLTKRRKGTRGPASASAKPRSLTEKLDVIHLTRDQMATELDAIVEYLRGTPKRDEVRRLAEVATYLDERLGTEREAASESVRQTDVSLALNVNYPNVLSQLEEVIRRIEQIRPDPANPELAFLPRGRARVPVAKTEADALRASAKRQVSEYIAAVEEFVENAHAAYKARVERNETHPRVHYLVRVYTDVKDLDPNEMAVEYSTLHSDAVAARRELGRGRLLRAVHRANGFGAATDGYASKVGAWEGSLLRGAGRWVVALKVLQEGLTLLATGGAVALTGARVAKGASALRTAVRLGSTLGGTGFVTGFGGSLYSQSTTGEGISGWKAARVGRNVGVDSALIGLAPGIGTTARNLAGVGETAVGLSRTSRYMRTGIAELGSGTLLQGGAALAKGDSVRDAMLGVGINAGLSGVGGLVLKDFARDRKGIQTIGGGLLGGGSNLLTGLAQGKGGADLATSTLSGVAGGAVGPHLEASNAAYLKGPESPPAGGTGTPTRSEPSSLGSDARPSVSEASGSTAIGGAGSAATPRNETPIASGLGGPSDSGGLQNIGEAGRTSATGGSGARPANADLPGPGDIESAFSDLSNVESGPFVSASADAPKGARVSAEGAHELDLGGITDVGVRTGNAPLQPGDPAAPWQKGKAPPETWLVDPTRADLTDPAAAAGADFKPNRTGFDYDVRNAQIRTGPGGAAITTPSGPEFAGQRVVGGARGAALDPGTGAWAPGSAPHDRPYNPLGQDASFQERPVADWHAVEQTHGPLTDEQRYALWFYSDDLSGQINPALRGAKAQQFVTDPIAVAAAASDLDRTMQPVPFDTIVHRKASMADFSDLGVSDPADLAGMVGKSYAHEGYTSTAVEAGHWSGEIDIVIQVPKGTRGRYLGGASAAAAATNPLKPATGAPKASMPGEMEFLIERGTSFTIQKAELDQGSGRWRVEVRIASQGVQPKPLANPVPLPGRPGPSGRGAGSGGPAASPTIPGTFPPRAPGPDTTTRGTFPPRAPGPDTTTRGTFPPRKPGPTSVERAEASMSTARQAREAAQARMEAALKLATSGDGEAGLGHARATVELQERRLDEATAAVALAEARLAAATRAGRRDSGLEVQLEIAKSDVGYRLFDLGQARNQVVRATRVAEGLAAMKAR
jgi:ADP-ribosyltransferase exoenzyme